MVMVKPDSLAIPPAYIKYRRNNYKDTKQNARKSMALAKKSKHSFSVSWKKRKKNACLAKPRHDAVDAKLQLVFDWNGKYVLEYD